MPHLFVQDLTVIDCSILDNERGLIGASWVVDIELKGKLDHQSMVFDFAKVKKSIKQAIDEHVDHKLLIPNLYNGTSLVHHNKNKVELHFTSNRQAQIKHTSPASALCIINCEQVTINSASKHLHELLLEVMPENVEHVGITLREEPSLEHEKTHFYTYSHGLKKHDGNCQRIAHGHRSRIHVWKNGKRADLLEQQIAKNWQDIYIASEEDITLQTDKRISFAYQCDQGAFSIELPKNRVCVIPCDSTIECLAEYLAKTLSSQNPATVIKVQAFEGVKKGAFAEVG